tara:strand:- start:132 stop:479 length:348 start_codon:yes stop_codon:yes gene_type:complete
MAHHKQITIKLRVGDSIDYPDTDNTTSKLNVTAVSDEDNAQYCLSSQDGTYNVNEYHSKLQARLNTFDKPEAEQKSKRDLLKAEARKMDISHPKNIKTPKLEALIEAHKNGAVEE